MGHRRAAAPAALWDSGYRYLLPGLLLAVGLVLNLLTPPHITFTPFFAAPPLIAAALLGLRATIGYGVASTLMITLLELLRIEDESTDETLMVLTVGTVSVIAVGINRLVERSLRQVASARVIAEAVQRAMVPDPVPRLDGVRLAARYRPAHREALIGGDLYAAVSTPFGVRLILGDVRGKGLEATDSVAVVLGCFRESASYEPELEAVGARLEASLSRATRERMDAGGTADESFVTAVVVEIADERPASDRSPEPSPEAPPRPPPEAPPKPPPKPPPEASPEPPPDRRGTVRLLNFGHPPPLLLTTGGQVRPLEPEEHALPLGLSFLDGGPPPVQTIELPPEAILLMYTDGVTEARDDQDRFYDPADRLRGVAFTGPDELLDWLLADLGRHSGAGADDIALLAACRDREGLRSVTVGRPSA